MRKSRKSHEYRRNDYKKLYEKTGGKFAAVSQNFAEQLLEIVGGVIDETNDGYWIYIYKFDPALSVNELDCIFKFSF
ncbi:MAG: hypothetical protein J6D02_00545 [Lachnospira sp.]|nr:hypothetical protein [Lachnospira sp.]